MHATRSGNPLHKREEFRLWSLPHGFIEFRDNRGFHEDLAQCPGESRA